MGGRRGRYHRAWERMWRSGIERRKVGGNRNGMDGMRWDGVDGMRWVER